MSIVALGVTTLLVVFSAAMIVSILDIHATDDHLSFPDAVWELFQRAIDPGQLANESKWSSRITLVTVTAIGLLLMSTLISIVNSTIERRLESTRRGRRPVVVDGHIAVIGWNSMGTKYTEEIAEALHDGEPIQALILADEDPVDLTTTIRDNLIRQRSLDNQSWIVKHPERWLAVRRGDIDHTADLLSFARVDSARAAIVLGRDGSDEDVMTVVLAILATLSTESVRRETTLSIIAAFQDASNGYRLRERIQRLTANSDGHPMAELIPVTPDLIRSGIESQVARHRGLSEVYRDIVDFDGGEIYIVPVKPNSSLTFGDLLALDDSTPLGIATNAGIDLWPTWGTPLGGNSAVVLAQSFNRAAASLERLTTSAVLEASRPGCINTRHPETFLVIGQNSHSRSLITGIRQSSPPGSTVDLLVDSDEDVPADMVSSIERVVRRDKQSDPLDDSDFVTRYNHVVVLSHDDLDDMHSDARVLTDILACRGHADHVAGMEEPRTIVAELRQRASKHIAGARLADDLLVNDALIASTSVQLAVNPHLYPILQTLLTPSSPVHLSSLRSGTREFDGLTIEECRRRLAQTTGEIPVAVRRGDGTPRVIINPPSELCINSVDELIILSRLPS